MQQKTVKPKQYFIFAKDKLDKKPEKNFQNKAIWVFSLNIFSKELLQLFWQPQILPVAFHLLV